MNVLTFDIEDWIIYRRYGLGGEKQISDILDRILDLLDERELQATFFCLGILARDYPAVIRRIAGRHHQVACHSDQHKWLTGLTPGELRQDTRMAIDSIEQITGSKVTGYRAPAFSITPANKWAFEILHENGIEFDCSIFPATRDFGGFPGFSQQKPAIVQYNGIRIKEFPIVTTKFLGKDIPFSGGGYFRMMPSFLLHSMFAGSDYVMTYFHIRDFDKAQKRYRTWRYFKDYYGINGAYAKFQKVIRSFEYVSLAEADRLVDWEKAPVVVL